MTVGVTTQESQWNKLHEKSKELTNQDIRNIYKADSFCEPKPVSDQDICYAERIVFWTESIVYERIWWSFQLFSKCFI